MAAIKELNKDMINQSNNNSTGGKRGDLSNSSQSRKIEKRWVIIIEREDGTVNDYRFQNKTEAKKWAALTGIEI